MIKIYRNKCSRKKAQKISQWLMNYHLENKIITKRNFNIVVLKQILAISDNGFEDILVPERKVYQESIRSLYRKIDLESITTKEMLELILGYPELLRTPITFNEKKLVVGSNLEELRIFLPRLSN